MHTAAPLKRDPAYIMSYNHPADSEAPWTALAIATRAGTNTENIEPGPTNPKHQRHFQPSIVDDVIVESNIKSDLKLCARALKLK